MCVCAFVCTSKSWEEQDKKLENILNKFSKHKFEEVPIYITLQIGNDSHLQVKWGKSERSRSHLDLIVIRRDRFNDRTVNLSKFVKSIEYQEELVLFKLILPASSFCYKIAKVGKWWSDLPRSIFCLIFSQFLWPPNVCENTPL